MKAFRWILILILVTLVALTIAGMRLRSAGAKNEASDPPPPDNEDSAESSVLTNELPGLVGSQPGETRVGDIDLSRIVAHIDYLASAELEGRGNGTAGAEEAALYIADQFKGMGLEPAGNSAFYHDYKVYTGVRVQGAIGMRDNARGYEYVKDYGPLGLSANGSHQSDLVFVGYGVTAPEYNYDDYAGVDVNGKIVLALLGEPGMRDSESPFDGTAPTSHSELYAKALNAASHGAAGLLLTAGPRYARGADKVWRISQQEGHLDVGILVCHVSRAAAASLVEPGDLNLTEAQTKMDDTYEPVSQRIPNQQVELKVELRRLETKLRNVIGRIPGRSEQSILLLANYDGFGMGADNAVPVFHPGANENASGVAALLEIARVLAAGDRPEKTIYFGCFSGRRLSFAGAGGFVRDRVIDPKEIEVVLSQFSLGSTNEAVLEIMGTSSGMGLGEIVAQVNGTLRAPVVLSVQPEISRSGDHIPFYKQGIPTLTVFGGVFDEYGTPKDTPDRIDRSNLLRRTRFVTRLLEHLSAKGPAVTFQR